MQYSVECHTRVEFSVAPSRFIRMSPISSFRKMIFYIVLYCFILQRSACVSISNNKSDWMNICLNRLSNNLEKSFQLRLYKNSSNGNEKFTKFTEKLSQKFPTVKVDLSRADFLGNGTFLEPEDFSDAGPVIYMHERGVDELNEQVKYFLDFYDRSYPKYTMPKCFVVYENESNMSNNAAIKRLLEYAWTKKFLDMSVLEILNGKSRVYLYTFNPFFDELTKVYLTQEVDIFPRKLRDLNQYGLKLPIMHNPPYFEITIDSSGSTHFNGLNYRFLKIVLDQMNIHRSFIKSSLSNPSEFFSVLLKKLMNQEYNMVPVPTLSIGQVNSSPILILNDDCIPYVGIIKAKRIVKFNLSVELIYFLICIPSLFFLKFIIFILRLKSFDFEMLDVVRIMLGISLQCFPKTFLKRIFVLFMFFTSMIFTIDFIGSLLSTLIVYDELTFNSIEEIMESDYKIAMKKVVQEIVFNSEKDYSSNILKQRLVGQDVNCPSFTEKDEKIICVLSMLRARQVIENSIQNGTGTFKMIPVKFGCNVAAYLFERASPFIVEFESIFLRMYESGIFYLTMKENKKKYIYYGDNQNGIVDDLLLTNLILLITFGLAISTIVFIFEIIFHYLFSIGLLQVK